MLPGMMMPTVVGTGFGYRNSTDARVNPSASIPISVPSGTANGDFLVLIIFSTSTGVTVSSGLSAWTSRASSNAANNSYVIYTRTASSEPASYTPVMSANDTHRAVMLSYSSPTGGFDIAGNIVNGTGASQTLPSVTTGHQGALLAISMKEAVAGTIVTPPSGMALRHFVSSGGTPAIAVYDLNPSPAGATGTKTVVWDSTGGYTALLFSIY